jgi:hypothetical protein
VTSQAIGPEDDFELADLSDRLSSPAEPQTLSPA